VIELGDSYEAPQDDAATGSASEGFAEKKGRTVAVTTEDMQKMRNDTFDGNEATRKTKKNLLKQQYGNFEAEGKETLEQTFNRLQAIVSHLEFIDVEIEQDDLNQKLLTSLAPEWLMHTIVWRNKSFQSASKDLDTLLGSQRSDKNKEGLGYNAVLPPKEEPKKISDALKDPSWGTIDEEVYVMQPPGFQDPEFPARVYKVEKAMYGLHQAPRAVYVDDTIFGSSNPQLYREFEALMHEKFQMSAMGELNFFLGLQVLQKKDDIFLSQDKYVGDILKKFRYSDVRSASTPMDKENPWGKDGT
nr:hypothetical protein [Tanacetum cinerariifolium]